MQVKTISRFERIRTRRHWIVSSYPGQWWKACMYIRIIRSSIFSNFIWFLINFTGWQIGCDSQLSHREGCIRYTWIPLAGTPWAQSLASFTRSVENTFSCMSVSRPTSAYSGFKGFVVCTGGCCSFICPCPFLFAVNSRQGSHPA